MGTKGDAARERILFCARELFAAKGYSRVTMKDICESVGMSRGGVYRYFPSTEAIFGALIEKEQNTALRALRVAEKNGVSPASILMTYIKNRIDMTLDKNGNIENAITEYAANSEEGKRILAERARLCVRIVAEQIERGRRAGQFTAQDSESAARIIVWLLEGMAKHNALIPLTRADINGLLRHVSGILGFEM
ncbi:MAG: TetR/AcrR family transcriptional regulator [Ruminococcaceae bacterium]|nr:TetR/AcrR family transcriptional regulator [Oscillospiraceae bacterium]